MTAPQRPGSPGLPLVDAALGSVEAPLALDTALGTEPAPAPAAPPGQPGLTGPAIEQPAPPSAFVARNGEAFLRDEKGAIFTVPEQLADRYVHEQGFIPATPGEVDKRLAEKEQEGFIGGAKAGGAALAEGLYGAVAAIPRGVAALGYAATGDEAYAHFARAAAPDQLFPTIAGNIEYYTAEGDANDALAAEEAERLSVERSRAAQRREWSALTTVAETAGLIGGTVATALAGGAIVGGGARALGAGSAALRGSTAAELAFGGGIARQAAIAGTEGILQGAASPFDDGGTPTQIEILKSALFSGLLSAGLAGGATGIGNRLARRAGAATDDAIPAPVAAAADEPIENLQAKAFSGRDMAAETAADDIARQIAPDAPPGIGREAVETKQFYDELDAERRAAIDAAGPNPKAKAAAADEATAKMNERLDDMKKSAGTINEDNWRGIKPTLRPLLKDEIIEAASRDLERSNNSLMKATDAIESFLDEAPQKVAKVRANLLASKVDDAAAMRQAYGTLSELRRTFSDTLMQRAREMPLKRGAGQAAREVRPMEPDPQFWKSHGSVVSSIERTLAKADEAFAQAKDAADAYIVMDQARREIAARVSGLAKAARSDDPRVFDPARILQKWAKEEYLGRLVPHLGDTATYGKQGAAQTSVNLARRDVIASGYLGDLTTILQKDFGDAVRVTDPAQTRSLLTEIDGGRRSLKQQQLLKNYSALEDMATAVKNGYELTPKQTEAIDEMLKNARAGREIMQTMEKQGSGVREKIIRNLMNLATDRTAGGIVGGILGGFGGAAAGAVVLPIVQGFAKDVARRVALHLAKDVATEGAERVAKEAVEEFAESGTRKAAAAVATETTDAAIGDVGASKRIPSSRISAAALGIGVGASGLIFSPTEGKPRDERIKIHRARQEVLTQRASNPAALQQAFASVTGSLAEKRPVMTTALAREMTAQIKTLQQELPGKKELSPIAARRNKQPSDKELRTSEALWEAATDPTSVFDDWKRGVVSYEKVRFSQKLYPGIWDLYRAAVVDAVGALPEDAIVNQQQLTQLDLLFGFNGALSPSVAPDFSKRIDAYSEQLKEQQAQQPSGGDLNLPTTEPTFAARVARGGRSS